MHVETLLNDGVTRLPMRLWQCPPPTTTEKRHTHFILGKWKITAGCNRAPGQNWGEKTDMRNIEAVWKGRI